MRTPWLSKSVGVVVFVTAGLLAVLLYLLLAGAVTPTGASGIASIGPVDISYGHVDLHPWLVVLTVIVVLAGMAGVFVMDRLLSLRATGLLGNAVPLSADRSKTPRLDVILGTRRRLRQEGTNRLVVLVPAHNEADRICATLDGLKAACPEGTAILVIADNCTDSTVELALASGVSAVSTVENSQRKAGALNQTLRWLLPQLDDRDVVMVVDADTVLSDNFVVAMLAEFQADTQLMAVGGLFRGEDRRGLLADLQRNEYVRYEREILRTGGRVQVLTGTASAFRVMALATVATSRGVLIPGRPGDVYDTVALTEDNELTLALKSLGARMVSPRACAVTTELMPTWRNLWVQRLRWQRGAVENIGAYGLTTATARSWFQQVGLAYGVFAFASFVLLTGMSLILAQLSIVYIFWAALAVAFLLERVGTAWRAGWRGRIVAALLIPELMYAVFLSAVFVVGVWNIATGHQAHWGHVEGRGVANIDLTSQG